MTTRRSAVAGYFYPKDSETLRLDLSRLVKGSEKKAAVPAIVVPHAGYVYSGAVAGEVYGRVEIPAVAVVLGPNHSGRGPAVAYQREGEWETPLGGVRIDERFAAMLERSGKLFVDDDEAHRLEHSIEVQLPFLQFLRPDIRFVPICLATADPNDLRDVGEAVAAAMGKYADPVLVVASSDFTHYEPHEVAKERDAITIADIESLNSEKLLEHVFEVPVTMCGFAGVAAAITAARARGAKKGELIRYQTSGEVSGDLRSVVGYAGMILR